MAIYSSLRDVIDELEDMLDESDDIIEGLDDDLSKARREIFRLNEELKSERVKIWDEAYAKGKAKKPDEPDEPNPYRT